MFQDEDKDTDKMRTRRYRKSKITYYTFSPRILSRSPGYMWTRRRRRKRKTRRGKRRPRMRNNV